MLTSFIRGAKVLIKLGVNIGRSSLFMTSFCLGWLTCHELLQRTRLHKTWSTANRNFLVSLILPFSIAWEQPHKRVEINYFVFPKGVEMFWNMLKNRRLVNEFKGSEVSQIDLLFKLFRH